MANTVIALKKSATPSAAPASLSNGEIAINYADGKLFYKNATGQIVSISSGGTSNVNSFSTINANGSLITAASPTSTLTILPGNNITITSDIVNDIITIGANTSGGANLIPVFQISNAAFDKANAANLLAYNTGIGANTWANTKLSNTDNVVFGGNLRISNTLYAYDVVIANSMIANVSGNVRNITITGDILTVNNIFLNTNVTTSANGSVVSAMFLLLMY